MENNEQLRRDAEKVFSNEFSVTPAEAGLKGVVTARFGFFSRTVFAIFAEDEETAKAYAKHQDCMHKVWESGIIMMLIMILITALSIIFAFLQLLQDNPFPLILLAVILVVAAVVYFVIDHQKLQPLDKKIHDGEGHLKVITFYHPKKGGWYKGVWEPEFLAKHIPSYDD